MGLPPEKILYVGNSFAYDVLGARKAGMKAAWITRGFAACSFAACSFAACSCAARSFAERSCTGGGKAAHGQADFVFSGYRQLRDYVLS
jgi:phosphoglycolate phosphatase-like HAD superfamily hydrolase